VELTVWGSEYGDVAFGPSDELLVSERFADLYKSQGLSGLEGFHKVKIVKVKRRGDSRLRDSPPKYFCVEVKRSRAAIDIAASGLVLEAPPTCDECRSGLVMRTVGVVLEKGTWSGEDIFIARGLGGTILASERFKAFFDKYHVNNGVLVDARKYSFDFYPWLKDDS
jgi:hypothetical protein